MPDDRRGRSLAEILEQQETRDRARRMELEREAELRRIQRMSSREFLGRTPTMDEVRQSASAAALLQQEIDRQAQRQPGLSLAEHESTYHWQVVRGSDLQGMQMIQYMPVQTQEAMGTALRDEMGSLYGIPPGGFNLGRRPNTVYFDIPLNEWESMDYASFDACLPIPGPEDEESRPEYANRLLAWTKEKEQKLANMLRPVSHGTRIVSLSFKSAIEDESLDYMPGQRAIQRRRQLHERHPERDSYLVLSLGLARPITRATLEKLDSLPRRQFRRGFGVRVTAQLEAGAL
jgi:hypothetical protein